MHVVSPHFLFLPRWIDEDTLQPEATRHADMIIKAGMQQLNNNPYMIILFSSFLIDVQGSYQSGYAQLQQAKKADPRQVQRPRGRVSRGVLCGS